MFKVFFPIYSRSFQLANPIINGSIGRHVLRSGKVSMGSPLAVSLSSNGHVVGAQWRNLSILQINEHVAFGREFLLHPSSFQFRSYGKGKKTQKMKIELSANESEALDMGQLRKEMETALNTLNWHYNNSVTPNLSAAIIGNLPIKVGKRSVPLREIAQLGSPNPRAIVIDISSQPSCVSEVMKELQASFHLNPVLEGTTALLVSLPKPSKEMRERLMKDAKTFADKAKVTIRRNRSQSIAKLRKESPNLGKDSLKRIEDAVQGVTDEFNLSVDALLKRKTEELHKP